MEVYHITHIAYEKGAIVRVNDFDGETYYHQNLSAAPKKIDDYLSEQSKRSLLRLGFWEIVRTFA